MFERNDHFEHVLIPLPLLPKLTYPLVDETLHLITRGDIIRYKEILRTCKEGKSLDRARLYEKVV